MSQMFDKIKVGGTKRSTFDLSHTQITTSDFGYLIPICYRDMVPNDDFVVTPSLFTRLSPLAVPTYGNIKCRVHHFFVPYRILYGHWDAFITQDKSNHTVPPFFTLSVLRQALATDPAYGGTGSYRGKYSRLMSNLGLNPDLIQPESGLGTERFSAFPFLAYYRIWLDWFADANIYDHPALEAAFNDRVRDGGALVAAAVNYLETRNVCFKKDYFTTAKLNPQDGDTPSFVAAEIAKDLNPGLVNPNENKNLQLTTQGFVKAGSSTISGSNNIIGQFTVEALRAANSLQRYLERNNFVGTKIINRILAHFGVQPTAERLDMAEFIGGDSFPIRIGDVTCTSAQAKDTDESAWLGLGAQAGKGIGAAQFRSYRYHAKEHGIFMSVMSILPDTGYYQGISRFWQKGVTGDALDYYHPEFENLGYQELLNREVYVPAKGSEYQDYDDEEVFGYVPRYAEYKFQNDILAGDFTARTSNVPEMVTPTDFNLDSWHLFRKFHFTGQEGNHLTLNENFVECNNRNNDYDRIFQFTDNDFDHFYFSIKMDVKATRPMTGFTAPSLDSTNEGDGNSMNLPYGGTRL